MRSDCFLLKLEVGVIFKKIISWEGIATADATNASPYILTLFGAWVPNLAMPLLRR
jgi:hypothetical protein